MLALGVYPEVSLKDARAAADEARRHLHGGVDPGGLRKVQKHSRLGAATNSFESIALEWFAKQKPNRAENHWTKVQWMLEKTLFPWLKTRPISEIKAPELLTVLRRIETRGAIETAKRVKMIAGQIFRFAVATGRAEGDPSQSLRGALAIPVKTRQAHIVPLSTQAVEVLRELHPFTGHFEFVFPSPRSPRRPRSNNAVLAAMRRIGIPKEVMCAHGFRAMARTILDEVLNYRVDYIEHQLAHAVRDANGRAYNRTAHLGARKVMMQSRADYLDRLRAQTTNSNLVALQRVAA